MVEQRLMTFDEKLHIGAMVFDLRKAGKEEEAHALEMTSPVQPWAAKFIKKYLGLDALLSMGFNLAEVEQAYGKEWLAH